MNRGTLKYHTVAVINNGVHLTDENRGREVKFTMTLTHWSTGAHHIKHEVTARFVELQHDVGSDTVFALFHDTWFETEDRAPKYIGESGVPLAFFR